MKKPDEFEEKILDKIIDSLEPSFKPLYISGSMAIFDLKVQIKRKILKAIREATKAERRRCVCKVKKQRPIFLTHKDVFTIDRDKKIRQQLRVEIVDDINSLKEDK